MKAIKINGAVGAKHLEVYTELSKESCVMWQSKPHLKSQEAVVRSAGYSKVALIEVERDVSVMQNHSKEPWTALRTQNGVGNKEFQNVLNT